MCVLAVPSMIYPIRNETITEGDSVTLSCNASGIPSPMVSWIKVDGHMTVSNISELEFTNIARSEAGEYRCEASNECGNASETAWIFVQCKLTITCPCNLSALTMSLFIMFTLNYCRNRNRIQASEY